MVETLLERIMRLVSDGYTVSIRPDYREGNIQIRLTKNNYEVVRVIDTDIRRHSYAWKSDEDLILYVLLDLEYRYEDYIKNKGD